MASPMRLSARWRRAAMTRCFTRSTVIFGDEEMPPCERVSYPVTRGAANRRRGGHSGGARAFPSWCHGDGVRRVLPRPSHLVIRVRDDLSYSRVGEHASRASTLLRALGGAGGVTAEFRGGHGTAQPSHFCCSTLRFLLFPQHHAITHSYHASAAAAECKSGAKQIGNVWAVPALANTACTFAVLWTMEKQFEAVGFNAIGIFLVSGTLYFVLSAPPTPSPQSLILADRVWPERADTLARAGRPVLTGAPSLPAHALRPHTVRASCKRLAAPRARRVISRRPCFF